MLLAWNRWSSLDAVVNLDSHEDVVCLGGLAWNVFPPESTWLHRRPLRTRPSFNHRRTVVKPWAEGASDKFHPLPAEWEP